MAGKFEGSLALVTGASRGIGLAVAQRLVDEGARVVITARNADGLRSAVDQLGADRATAFAGRADDAAHRQEVFAHLAASGGLDLFVGNTGINPVFGPLLDIETDSARKILEVNLLASFEWARGAIQAGLAESGGAMVTIASIAGLIPSPGIAFYGISKAALIAFTRQLALEVAPAVRVNTVAPAVIKTDFSRALYAAGEEHAARAYPLRRLGETDDVAGAVAFLLSSDAAWITGQTLVIDGGLSLVSAG